MTSTIENDCETILVGPFATAAKEVFTTMLGADCRLGEVQKFVPGERHHHDVTSVIGLSGGMIGAIALSLTCRGALTTLERMTGIEAEEVDEFVRDCVGEMSNMIGGKGKRELARYELKLGLPQVIVGEDYAVYSPRWARHYWLSLDSDVGPCTLDVGFDIHRSV